MKIYNHSLTATAIAALCITTCVFHTYQLAAQDFDSANPIPRRQKAVKPTPEPSPVKNLDERPTMSSGPGMAYVYGDGDSLERLAKLCGTEATDLLKLNNLKRSELREGQVLQLPRPVADAKLTAAFTPERQLAREVWRGVRGGKRVALTFDAGGEDDAAKELTTALDREGAPATFFVTGDFAAKNKELVKGFAKSGPVFNHSWSHPEFTKIPEEQMHEELERTDWAIRDVTGKTTKPCWRPPFGDRDERVLRATANLGYQSIYWTLDSLDSVGEKKSPDFIVERILSPRDGVDAEHYLDGAIILMHVGEPGTAEAIPRLIAELRKRGFKLVTVPEILQPPTSSF